MNNGLLNLGESILDRVARARETPGSSCNLWKIRNNSLDKSESNTEISQCKTSEIFREMPEK